MFKDVFLMHNSQKNVFILMSSVFLLACTNQQVSSQKFIQESGGEKKCQVNMQIERNAIPKTLHNMSLPEFGQGVIGWKTGPEGAKGRLNSIKKEDLKEIQDKGTSLEMIKEWQAFYENEVRRNPCNPTAPYRAVLMKKIAELWEN
ncbi:DUF4951 domain-containing protein [Acinetobacter towneri]|uniref:DUF4951 domain-containing protein n=1 Tax=Acinetobacter towneri TaxID=202956 RepID=UPI001AA0253D|nr:DUF4951 domain-containing protein [Acinetobacter towneri]QTD65204.1 DUF4951 domain-containing protein [Acinetobacter towneri]